MIAGMTMLFVAAAESVQEAEKAGGLPQLNAQHFLPQLFWLAVTFVALLFIMAKIALPRVGEVLEERADRIKRDLDAAANLKAYTDKALADYEKALSDARADATGIAKETRDRLQSETDAERRRVDAQIAAKLQEAEQRIASTKSKAVSAIGGIASDTARAIVSKLIGQDVSAEDAQKAIRPAAGE